GDPGAEYPWPFVGCPLLPGREPAEAGLTEQDRAGIGTALGRFLRMLHAPQTLAVADPDALLPAHVDRRADMPVRVARTPERLAALPDEIVGARRGVEPVLWHAEQLPPSTSHALVHGDLHFRHVLVDGDQLTDVIDWGDVCRADPAVDLVLYWC